MPMEMAAAAALRGMGGQPMMDMLPPEDLGWKDTVLVAPGETVRVLIRYQHYAGPYVHHCHNLEHEDNGMMQNLEARFSRSHHH
jgi:FtsP/CotA-like multicopper oxidase with cupredoxin domain